MPRSDADRLLDTFKAFSIAWSDVGQCNICADAAPHAMSAKRAPRQHQRHRARGVDVRAYQEHDVVAVDELFSHVTHVRPLTRPRVTPSMKELARN
ncbi:hypothetical protein PHMEG_00010680 [Phytophthora megakarya]|uniref:Uncharacterized protein n=1 Tax=Phytophthora megakarya TaxID=4795 RepID=A0A225WDN8_9STRA|nr:hypothetical protein PHMEG_00010680 [Phytophthora megakarya]